MKQWLAERLQMLLPQLAELGTEQEAEIQRLCEAEIASWRARPTMRSPRSLNTPMIETRNAIRERLSVTKSNSWINSRTKKREDLALRYMNFSEEEWAEMRSLTEEGRQERLEGQQFLDEPLAVIEKGRQLLGSQRWEDIAVGLAVTTGRRLTEILKTARFHPMTDWTVEFEGQLKQKAEMIPPYEIPTLVEAEAVIGAWLRLRGLLDCQALSNDDVEALYGEEVRVATDRHYAGLVPYRAGKPDSLFTHLFRSCYGTLAVWLFAPPVVNALVYKATIYGHYWVLRAKTEQQRQNYISTLHYDDYKIGDGWGNIDGRQGIRLGEPGVKVLARFQEAVDAQAQKQEREMIRRKQEETAEPLVVKATKTGYSMLKPKQATAIRILTIAREQKMVHHDEVLSLLTDTYRLYEQMEDLLTSLAETTSTPLETLKAVVDAEQKRDVAPAINEYLQERWGTTLQEMDALLAQAAEQGDGQPVAYLREQVEKQVNYKQGPVKRQEHYQQLDFTTLSLEQLKAMRIPEATTERIRRAVQAIMAYNQAASHDLDRWFIRAKEIKDLVGGRGELIAAYLKEHHQEIAQHHQEYGLTEKFNQKPFAITEKIHLS